MFVRDVCTMDVRTVLTTASAREALLLASAAGLRAVPVVADGMMVGVVTTEDLYRRALAGESLDVPVATVMEPPPEPVHLASLIEEAAARMLGQPHNFLPVVDRDGTLRGIVTRDALFREFCRMFGVGETNTRFTLSLRDRPGQLARITEIVRAHGGDITQIIAQRSRRPGYHTLVLRVSVASPGALAHAFAQAGFAVVDAFNFENGRRIGSLIGFLAEPGDPPDEPTAGLGGSPQD
ncbi:MAG: CBS domain-containing protein [Clostridia bacterium]|nr:CBS domain-containing protein [Clostridia bacterium]